MSISVIQQCYVKTNFNQLMDGLGTATTRTVSRLKESHGSLTRPAMLAHPFIDNITGKAAYEMKRASLQNVLVQSPLLAVRAND